MNETVSPAVGAVDIHIGIDAPPGREIDVPFAISYNSNSNRHSGFMDNAGYLAQGGWRYITPLLQYSFSVTPVYSPRDRTIIVRSSRGHFHRCGPAVLVDMGLALAAELIVEPRPL